MPKCTFKPSCSLSKNYKKQRENHRSKIDSSVHVLTKTLTEKKKIDETCPQLNFSSNSSIDIQENLPIATSAQYCDVNISSSTSPSSNLNSSLGCIHFDAKQEQPISLPSFQAQLASFIVSSRLSKISTNKLLKLLKSVVNLESLQSLPLDYRTLLCTPRSNEIIPIEGGEYIHFGILNGLTYLYQNNDHVRQLRVFELWFNIDGLPIAKNGSSFWPILCGFFLDNHINPFIVGAYFGSKKPQNVDQYLSPFINELSTLLNNGVLLENNTITIHVKGLIADSPARAFIKQVKGHSGYYGCEKCTEEGCYISHCICFPNGNADLRTDESFTLRTNEEHHIGVSPLLKIPGFGLVSCVPLDYMHLCCLGVMKKILKSIVRGSVYTNGSCGSTRLSKDQIIIVNSRMKIIAKWLSTDFARFPEDLNYYHTFKATEFRQILMYTGPFLFKDIVSEAVYNNFLVLHIAMRILACTNTVYTLNAYADSLIKYFFKTFSIVYGSGNISYNVHSIIHLAADCKKYGVLDNFSSFPYENYLQHIKKIIQPSRFPLVQLHNRIKEERECNFNDSTIHYPFLDGHHYEGPLINTMCNKSVLQYSTLILKNYSIRLSKKRRSTKKDNCVIISSSTICIVQNILNRNGEILLVCKKFQNIDSLYKIPCSSMTVGMFKCSGLSSINYIYNIKDVKYKGCYFPKTDMESENVYHVCALLHS